MFAYNTIMLVAFSLLAVTRLLKPREREIQNWAIGLLAAIMALGHLLNLLA